jgi:hypothetical protein
MGIILIGLIGISTVYLIRWLVSKFESWSMRIEKSSLQWELFQAFKVVVIIIIVIIAIFVSLIAATFDYSIIFK